jgi:AhpD family alkylhydroperoxidase
MSRLADIREQDVTGKAAEIFGAIKKAMGKVPNAYLTIGGHSPAALQQALAHNAMLSKSSLNAKELEAINLAVSEATGCDYCLAAHTLMAKKRVTAASKSMPCAAASLLKMPVSMRWSSLSRPWCALAARSRKPTSAHCVTPASATSR